MKGAGTHLLVVWLEQYAALPGPVFLQGQDQFLESLWRFALGVIGHHFSGSRSQRESIAVGRTVVHRYGRRCFMVVHEWAPMHPHSAILT